MSSFFCLTLLAGSFEVDQAFRIAVGDRFGNFIHYQSGLLEKLVPCLMTGLMLNLSQKLECANHGASWLSSRTLPSAVRRRGFAQKFWQSYF